MNVKKLYEELVLSGRQPTPEENETLKGTVWGHRLNGTKPNERDNYTSFKLFYEDDVPAQDHRTRAELADVLVDKIEDRFNLHFSVLGASEADNVKLPMIQTYAVRMLNRMKGNKDDKKEIAVAVKAAKNINELMIKLNFLTS